jgi:hypothetical protein
VHGCEPDHLSDTLVQGSTLKPVIDLSSARTKVARAREHMKAIKGATNAFFDANPYEVGHRVEAEGRIHVFFLDSYSPPPEALGLLVGDAVHNLRSSLDHVAFALAQDGARKAGRTMSQGQIRSIQYPIQSAQNDFKEHVRKGRLKYVQSGPKALIEMYQPYNINRKEPHRSAPGVLASLDNADKHRLIPTLGQVISYERPEGSIDEDFKPFEDWKPNAVIVDYTFAETKSEKDVVFTPTFSLAIDGAWPPTMRADEALETYAEWIETFIIEQLEQGITPPT